MLGHLGLDRAIRLVSEQIRAEALFGDFALEADVLLRHRLVFESGGSLALSSAGSETALSLLGRDVALRRGEGTASFLCCTIFLIDVHQISRRSRATSLTATSISFTASHLLVLYDIRLTIAIKSLLRKSVLSSFEVLNRAANAGMASEVVLVEFNSLALEVLDNVGHLVSAHELSVLGLQLVLQFENGFSSANLLKGVLELRCGDALNNFVLHEVVSHTFHL
jgi:hypothetical protein